MVKLESLDGYIKDGANIQLGIRKSFITMS